MINEEDRKELIEYRYSQSKEAILEVQKLIDNDLLKIAVYRIYYGMFYTLTALALKYNFQSSKHLQLIGWFNKNFVKENLISHKYGKILREAFKNRMDGDYAPYIEFTKEDTLELYAYMKDFINEVGKLLKKDKAME